MERNDQVEARLDKVKRLRAMGVDPYPYGFAGAQSSVRLKAFREGLLAGGERVHYAGRIVRFNRKGKMAFMHLKDDHGRLQVVATRDEVGADNYEVVKLLDLGDWVGASGTMFETRAGEYSVRANALTLLAKAVRPLPAPKEQSKDGVRVVYDRFSDVESRYRRRYLDLALNDDARRIFRARAAVIASIREYLTSQGYLEVDTPVLQPVYGGANARPFVTHHNTLDMDLYLRISNELYLKRCVIGGLSRVFEFSRVFRNEGIDRTHNPEFTTLEFYQAYADYKEMMTHFENLFAQAARAIHGGTLVAYQGREIDLTPPWQRMTMNEALRRYASLDTDAMDDDALRGTLRELGKELKGGYLRGLAIQAVFEALCEEHLIQPVFILDYPRESTPLCKAHRRNPALVERFEPYINGWEVGNAYSELNDPALQRELLEEQVRRGRGGEEETHPLDEEFLLAMEYGMPPMGGVGIGIDRMVMLLTDAVNIKDVQLFPLMRPE